MGMFGGIIKKINDPDFQMRMAASAAYANGDPGTAAQILQRGQDAVRKQQEAQLEAMQMQQLEAAMASDPALADPRLRAYARANPKAYIETRFQAPERPRAPSELERAMTEAGVTPGSEQWRKMMRQRAEAIANPQRYFVDPATGVPRPMPGPVPQVLSDDDWGDAGGAGGNASGGFPDPLAPY